MLQNLLLLFFASSIVVYFWAKWRFSYWKRKGVAYPPTKFPIGNLEEVVRVKNRKPLGIKVAEIYREFKAKGEKFAGIYLFTNPVFLVIDRQLAKNIFIRDFDHFTDHSLLFKHPKEFLSMHLFSLDGEKWRDLRGKLTPTFTSGKIKMMFNIIRQVGDKLNQRVIKLEGTSADFKELTTCFTTDVIGSCAFGIDTNALGNPDCDLRQKTKSFLEPRPFKQFLELLVSFDLLAMVGYKSIPKESTEFFIDTMTEYIQHREKTNVVRKDFVHLLLQLKNRGSLNESEGVTNKSGEKGIITMEETLSMMFLFFLAGYETSAITTSFLMHQLAVHQDCQDKLRDEIHIVLAKHGGQVTYESLQEMTYAQKCIDETLRLFPPASLIPRKVTQTYRIPDSNVILEKGQDVFISAFGMQRDPEFYPNPDVFDPENFSEESKASRAHLGSIYFPFGEGPRQCLGLRFGITQIKVALVSFLRNHRYTLSSATPKTLTFKPNQLGLGSNEALLLDIHKIN